MAIDQITSGEVLNSANIGAKGVDSGKKAERAENASNAIKFVEKKTADKAEFTSEVANANKEAAASKINSREEAIELMKALKQTAAEKPENTLAAHGNVATDAALALLQ